MDAAFGSCGSFFDQAFEEGSYEVNPVFVPEVLDAAVQHVLALLRASARPLSFVVVVPAWPETRAFATLHGAASADVRRWSLRLSQPAHGYCDGGSGGLSKGGQATDAGRRPPLAGAQHQRRARYRPASFDTLVSVLQNAAGAERWPVRPAELEADLAAAFKAPLAHAEAAGGLEAWESRNRTEKAGGGRAGKAGKRKGRRGEGDEKGKAEEAEEGSGGGGGGLEGGRKKEKKKLRQLEGGGADG